MGKAKVLVIRDYLCGVYENEVDLIENTYGGSVSIYKNAKCFVRGV